MSHLSFGQSNNNGFIYGRVYDSKNNQPVAFASIAIWETPSGTLSDTAGNFSFSNVKPGYAELKVSCVGYEPYTSEQFLVTNADKKYIEIHLNETTKQIDEVVVKASKFRRDDASPLSQINIGIKEIEKEPGGNRDISKVLQSYPGVASTPAYRNDIIVRGGGAAENRFYLDGVEIPNLNHFATQGASGGPVGIINVDLVREVNFLSGAFPSDRGNALSSVIEIKQIDGNKDKTKVKASVGASDMALTLDGPITNNTTYIFSVRHSYLQFLFSLLQLPFLPTYSDMQFKIRTKINTKNEISFIGLGALDYNALNLAANKTESERYILNYLPVNNQWNYTIGAVYRHYRENNYDTWVISRNELDNVQFKYFDNNKDSGTLLNYHSYEIENKFRYENNAELANGLKTNFGASFEYAQYYNNTFRQTLTGIPEIYLTNIDFFKWGIFGQVSKTFFNNRLLLSLGIRSDAINYNADMSNILHQISPRFSSSYSIAEKWHWNFNTGKYYELPPYTTLGFKDNSGNFINKENGMKYISVAHYVTGFDFLPNVNSKLSLEGFFKYYQHYPFSVNDSVALASEGADFGTYGDEGVRSTGTGRAYGMEFLYQNTDLMGANVTLSYTLVRSEFQNIYGKYVPSAWDNHNLFNIVVRKEFKRNWTVGAKWRFIGGTPYTPVDLAKSELVTAWDAKGQAYLDFSKFNTLRLRSYHQLDMRIDKEYYFTRWSLTGYIDVQNVYDFKSVAPPAYLVDNSVPISGTPPRYTLKELPQTNGGTILPTIGIIVQF
jgi:hypothetical protein